MVTSVRGMRNWRLDAFSPPVVMAYFTLQEFIAPYVYACITQSWQRFSGPTQTLSLGDLNLGLGVLGLYIVAWSIGYAALRNFTTSVKLVAEPQTRRPILVELAPFILAVGVYIAVSTLNPGRNFTYRAELTQGIWGKLLFGSIACLFATFCLTTTRLLTSGRDAISRGIPTAFFMSLVMIALLISLGGRARALFAVLYAVLLWHYLVKPLRIPVIWSLLIGGTVVAVLMDYVRLVNRFSYVDLWELAFGLQYGRNFDSLFNLSEAIQMVRNGAVSHNFGTALIADVLGDLGVKVSWLDSRQILMTEVYRMRIYFAGFPLSKPGEFFLAFGWIGPVIGGLGLGALSKLLYVAMIRNRMAGAISPTIYITLLLGTGIAQADGYFFNNLTMASVNAVLVIAFAVLGYGYRLTPSLFPTWRRRAPALRTVRHRR
jgi:hypothetical protein